MTSVQPRLHTALHGRYTLERELGAGGMATVYLAHDVRHNRRVALKVIREDLAAGMGAERFLREIQLAASLHHPNILPLYDSGEADGILYYVMPLAAGESLRDRLGRERTVPLADALRLTREVADALDHAHRQGVVHRDIKPENILLHEGHALITDFGIGKAVSQAAAGETLTQLGFAIGTPAYMSPEQASGDTALDGRSDLYSLGCVLYEMLAGEPPFTGPTAAAVIMRRLAESPPDLAAKTRDLPTAVVEVARRLMATDPEHRFATGAEVSSMLARAPTPDPNVTVTSGATRAQSRVPWVAVLPFTTSARDPDLADFSDGLVDEITTGLSLFSHLRVVAHASAGRAGHAGDDVRRVGEALGARFILSGSVRKSGSTIRVSAQVADTSTGTTLWAESFDRDSSAAGIFAVQDELTDRIVATVADEYGALVRAMVAPLRDRPVDELTAAELVLRWYALGYQVHPEEHAVLRAALERVVEQEPDHAPAWAFLADARSAEVMHGLNPEPDSLPRARFAAQRAVDLDPTLQHGWFQLAKVAYFSGDLAAFPGLAERAMSLNPRNTGVGAMLAMLIAFSGDWERGYHLIQRMMALNPHHPGWFHFVPYNYHLRNRNYAEALASAKRVNMPDFAWTHSAIAMAAAELGLWDDARAAVQTLRERFPWVLTAEASGAFRAWFRDDAARERRNESLRKAMEGPPPREAPGKSIAVLPFANMSGPDDEFFSDGITEEIINVLAQLPDLKVAARTSSFAFKGKNEDLRAVGDKLGVTTVLEGSVRRSGQRLRITAQLINVSDGYHLWSERFDRDLTDIFEVQDEIAAAIASKLKVTLGESGRAAIRPATANIEAYELYLKGRTLLLQRGPSLLLAIESLERAIALDSRYAPPRAALGEAYAMLGHYGIRDPRTVMPRARELLEAAIALDPSSAEAHSALALVTLVWNRDRDGAESLWKKAISLNPRSAQIRAVYGAWYLSLTRGRWEEADAELEQAVALDPLSAYVFATKALSDWTSGRPEAVERAVSEAVRAVELDPDAFLSRWILQQALNAAERWEEAVDAGNAALAMSRRHSWALHGMVVSLVALDRLEEARAIHKEMLERSRTEFMQVSIIATVAIYLGEVDDGISLMWKGLTQQETNVATVLPHYPFLGLPDDHPERAKLLAAIGWNVP